MANYFSGDLVGGDKFNGPKYVQNGSHNTFNVTNNHGSASLDSAIEELRAFIEELTREGAVTVDGTVTDPSAVVRAVGSHQGRLAALTAAVSGGATEAVLRAVQGGVAALVVALLGSAAG